MQTHAPKLALPPPAASQATSVATASALAPRPEQMRSLLPQLLPRMTVGGAAAAASPAQSFNIYGGTGARANQV